MSPENKLIVLYLFTIAKSGHKQHRKGTERQHKRILIFLCSIFKIVCLGQNKRMVEELGKIMRKLVVYGEEEEEEEDGTG